MAGGVANQNRIISRCSKPIGQNIAQGLPCGFWFWPALALDQIERKIGSKVMAGGVANQNRIISRCSKPIGQNIAQGLPCGFWFWPNTSRNFRVSRSLRCSFSSGLWYRGPTVIKLRFKDAAMRRLNSYLRTDAESVSVLADVLFGVRQASVIDPLVLVLYVMPLSNSVGIIESMLLSVVSSHKNQTINKETVKSLECCRDDTARYTSAEPTETFANAKC